MPERAEEIRRAHLSDVTEALKSYAEEGHEISLETEYIAEDRGTITFTVDLSRFHPMLQQLSQRRFGVGEPAVHLEAHPHLERLEGAGQLGAPVVEAGRAEQRARVVLHQVLGRPAEGGHRGTATSFSAS